MPVPVSADGGPSPPSEHGEHPPRGYRPPPPGYGALYPPYGYPAPYGPPPPGYGHPPPGYAHHPPPSGYSPPGYPGRAVYAYPPYEGPPGSGYPMPHPRESRSISPPFQRGPGSHGRPSSQQRRSPANRPESRTESAKSSPEQMAMRQRETPDNRNAKVVDERETERLRQAALADISPAQVAPIKTSFHFFVQDVRESIRQAAVEEVRRKNPEGKAEPYLVNSNMNCRLMKAWEELSPEERNAYTTKEEADRRRFMEEEEIASRHCATLTARSKSPKTPERRSGTPSASPTSCDHHVPPPSPISRMSVQQDSSNDADEKKIDDHSGRTEPRTHIKQEMKVIVSDGDGTNKRSSPKTEAEEEGASPPKRNRVDNEGAEGIVA